MKISEIINNLDKSEGNSDYVDLCKLAEEFGIYSDIYSPKDSLITCYWIARHLCTDTHVGFRAYFFNNTFVAMSVQEGRKCDEHFFWASEELRGEVKGYIFSLSNVEEEDITLLNLDDDIGETYPIDYGGQFIRKSVLYKGKPVKIVNQLIYEFNKPSVCVLNEETGEEKWVYPEDIETPFNLVKERYYEKKTP